ncbi:hypothetical protein PHMEG_00015721 [Phytophthora megakarya]|uniref:Uncharacterized protein n=1 Tax=Phytophthora megakarya TaxID=4795 RepID=A0A225W1M3_9STRA|nr:hypothetical protein PHMEG_00015721 [Phytophthora megakarya]
MLPIRADHLREHFGFTGYPALRSRPAPLTFDCHLDRRADSPIWRIAVSYARLESDHLEAYWESTHYLEITKAMCTSDLDLLQYHLDRRQRRIRVGDPWRKLLVSCLPMMWNLWADNDLLLDPFFLHLPTEREPRGLITALVECDQDDPWRNHFRDRPTDHPSLRIPRHANKFNPPTAPMPP